ncbi:hypothetical protein GQ53DRAFT_751234 [Thozetella sp. PMI_491]|nr:hypothetical protein GQ53DRAFT_751234 [Thozetella sp. PMI_491]
MAVTPIFASPALPTELLRYILQHCVYPTTLIVCSAKDDFLASLAHDIAHNSAGDAGGRIASASASELLTASLQQLGVAKHIQTVFVPTVSHLRAYLSVFAVGAHTVPPPPSGPSKVPRLLLYGFLDIHRGTSEWTAQALSNTVSILLDAASDLSFQATIVEPRTREGRTVSLESFLDERMPVVKGGARQDEQGNWMGRTVDAGRVLGRWFDYRKVEWER